VEKKVSYVFEYASDYIWKETARSISLRAHGWGFHYITIVFQKQRCCMKFSGHTKDAGGRRRQKKALLVCQGRRVGWRWNNGWKKPKKYTIKLTYGEKSGEILLKGRTVSHKSLTEKNGKIKNRADWKRREKMKQLKQNEIYT
jgi:hypothetical protein